jgi:ubiquitin C-terminal hydrolase
MSMQEFLKMQNTFVDGFKCPKCEDTGKKFMSTRLTMVPEILIVLFKKYEVVKSYTEFPLELTFDTRVGNTLKYNLVAQCEHVGSFSMAGGSGGHYYAICARKVEGETMAFQLNDSHCSPAELKATQNTYMAVYHIQ